MTERPDFTLSRGEAAATVEPGLASFAYHTVLFQCRHPDGPVLAIEHIPNFPVYAVLWRPSAAWGSPKLVYVDAFEEPDNDLAWARAMRNAETAFDKGPPSVVSVRSRELSEKNAENGKRGGQARAKNAKESDARLVEALRLANTIGITSIPAYDPKKWEAAVVPEARRFFLGKVGTAHETGIYMEPHGDGGHAWDVKRQWVQDGGERVLEDTVSPSVRMDYAVKVLGRLALSDTRTWNLREVDQFNGE